MTLLHVWPNAIPVKNIYAPLHGARVRILILSDFASAMIADKLLVTTAMTHPSWLEAVQWCVLAGGRSLPLLLLQRLRQQSVVTGVIVEVGTGILTDCVPRNVFEQTFHN